MCAMAGRRRRSIGSDYTSDEEFELEGSEDYDVTSEDEEMDDSDALSDADAGKEEEEESPDSEVEDDADYEEEDEDDDFVVGNPVRRRPVAKKKSLRTFGGGEKRGFSRKKPRGRPRKEPVVPEEDEDEDEYEYEDDSDEDFSPDEEENEEVVKITIRKRTVMRKGSGGRRGGGRRRRTSRSVELVEVVEYEDEDEGRKRRKKKRSARGTTGMTRRKKRGKDGVGTKRSKRKKRRRKKVEKKTSVGTVRGRGRRRGVITSDDEDDLDFIVEDVIPVRGRGSRVGSRKSGNVGRRRKRQEMDLSDCDLSDFESPVSGQELRCLPFVNANCKKRRTERVSEKEKGKGKEIDDSGKQVCGICLSEERKGVARGVLNSCAHYFCFACIMEWSKVESRCPVCKQRFRTISKTLASNTILGLRPTVVRVPKRDQVYQPSEEELWGFLNPYENVVCMECLQGGDDDLMLLCDLCDSPAHTYCVGLEREVPEGDWYCSACRSAEGGQVNSHAHQDSENALVSNNGGVPSYATSDRLAALHEILEQPIPRGSDSGWSPRIPSAETNGIARASGPSALTLSGRRALSQRIRILFSSGNRARNLVSPRSPSTNVAQFGALEGDVANSEHGQRQRAALPDELSAYNGRPRSSGLCDLNSPPTPCASFEDSHL